MGTIDTSSAENFVRPDVSLWYATFPLELDEALNKVKIRMGKRRRDLKVGYTMCTENVNGVGTYLASELNGGLVVDRLTCNG